MGKKVIITSDSGILGGEPCFAGTRIPLTIVLYHLASHGMDAVIRDWPYLKKHRTWLVELNNTISMIHAGYVRREKL